MTKFDKDKIKEGWKITKQGNFRKNNQTKYKGICKKCEKEFLGVKNQIYCSRKCSSDVNRLNNSKSIKYKDVLNLFNDNGYEVLTTEKEWNNRNKGDNKVKFICPNGHKHYMLYNNFQKGERCLYCSKHAPVSWNDVIDLFEVKKGWKILSKESEWQNASSKIKFQCDKGHIYSYTYTSLKSKDSGCPYCNSMIKIEFKDIKKWFEDENWTVLSKEDEYVSQNTTQIKCICPNGHEQLKSVRKWRMGRRCPFCITSGPELEIKKYVDKLNIEYISNDRSIGVELDIYVPSFNKAIEFNGDYWHCNPEEYDKNYFHKHKGMYAYQIWERDEEKARLCKEKGINLMIVWEKDWKTEKDKTKNSILEWINK